MYIQYRKSTGEVISFSDGKNKISDKIGQKSFTISTTNKKKLITDYNVFVKDGKLVYIKRTEILDKEKTKEIIDKIKTGKHTNEELAELLKQLTK